MGVSDIFIILNLLLVAIAIAGANANVDANADGQDMEMEMRVVGVRGESCEWSSRFCERDNMREISYLPEGERVIMGLLDSLVSPANVLEDGIESETTPARHGMKWDHTERKKMRLA